MERVHIVQTINGAIEMGGFLDFISNFIEITGIFLTTLFKGELFDIVDENDPRYGKTKYKLIFSFSKQKPDINNNYTVLIENDLNTNKIVKTENYKSLVTQYNEQNNKIEETVKKYNKSVNDFNSKLSIIPNNITSKLFGMKLEKNYD